MSQELIGTALEIAGKKITGIKDDLSDTANALTNLVTQFALEEALSSIVLAGTNVGEIFNVRTFGGVPNAVIPASGSVITGTGNTTPINDAIAAAPSNGSVFVGAGNWFLNAPLNTITTKRLNFLCIGNLYVNGINILTIGFPGGADRQHTIVILGSCVGRVNIPAHSKTTVDANTGPDYTTFTGCPITLLPNVNSMHAKLNLIEGFQKGIEIQGGGAGGSQENTFAIQKLNHNAIGVNFKSTDGVSWCDKNHIKGFDGGSVRISGGVAWNVDGFSGAAATNGENFNGAFRSNKIEFLAESVDQVCTINGDVTEPKIDITIEAGTNTGVFKTPAIQCLSTGPNVLRGPKWVGQGILLTNWMTNGMGVNGIIDMQIWQGPGSTTYIGNKARIDNSGNINIDVRSNLAKTVRDALLVQSASLRCVNEPVPKVFRTATSTYSNVTADAYATLQFNFTTATFNAVNASTNVGVYIRLQNIHASGIVNITGVTGIASLAAGRTVDIESNGVSWRALINP